MDKNVHRSGFSLLLAGIGGALFFWLTDPRYGLHRGGLGADIVDRMNEARLGTLVGIVGSGMVVLVGLFLMTRRAA